MKSVCVCIIVCLCVCMCSEFTERTIESRLAKLVTIIHCMLKMCNSESFLSSFNSNFS